MYYAVLNGRTPGIYNTWKECEENVKGFSNAKFHSFKTIKEAEDFMNNKEINKPSLNLDEILKGKIPVLFTDGSFNKTLNKVGCGGFILMNGEKIQFTNSSTEEKYSKSWNVGGEILGIKTGLNKALELGISEIIICYDYNGIEKWATGEWKSSIECGIEYINYINDIKNKIKLNFIHTPGHTGIEGNEEADKLAKIAAEII